MATELSQAQIDRLSREIEQRRKELDEDLRALTRVRKMLEHSKNGSVQRHLPLDAEAYSDAGFNESVRMAARGYGTVEFTVADIEAALTKQGVKLPAVNPRKRISTVLKAMCDHNALVVVKAGIGKSPHVYRNA